MGVKKPWLRFTLANAEKAPDTKGIYEIAYVASEGKRLWRLGTVPNLRKRLVTRLHEPQPPDNCYFRYFEAGLSSDVDEVAGELFDSYNAPSREAWER